MKLLIFTDIHGDEQALTQIQQKAKEVDMLICAGDLTFFGQDLNSIITELDEIKKPVLTISGNHDNELELQRACEKSKYVKYIDENVYKTKNLTFFGYSGDYFAFEDEHFNEVISKFDKKGTDSLIIITHQPPYNTKVDEVRPGEHVGSKTYKEYLDKNSLPLWICGHIHECEGLIDEVNGCKIINPGPEGMVLTVED